MSLDTRATLEELERNLLELNSDNSKQLNEQIVSNFVSKVSLDGSVLNYKEELTRVLNAAVKLLYNRNLTIDHSEVVEILSTVLTKLTFDEIEEVFKISKILEALDSKNPSLQVLALRVLSKASPPDILSNTSVVPKIINLFSEAPIEVQSEAEQTLEILMQGQLIRRRILSEDSIDQLMKLKKSNSTTVRSRVLTLMGRILPYGNEDDIPEDLYLVDDFVDDGDILYTLFLIQFYTDLLQIVRSSLSKDWILHKISREIEAIAKLYNAKDRLPDIEQFALTDIAIFFSQLSYISLEATYSIDERFLKLKDTDSIFLSKLNPEYLVKYHANILNHLEMTSENTPVYIHLLSDESSFKMIKGSILTSRLMRFSYLELMKFLVELSNYRYSGVYLLHELPQIMNKVIKDDDILDPDCFKSRKKVIENLVQYTEDDLDIWNVPIHREYFKVNPGKISDARTAIQDVYL